jgi:tetratricopeptide (TPR) repeat protein
MRYAAIAMASRLLAASILASSVVFASGAFAQGKGAPAKAPPPKETATAKVEPPVFPLKDAQGRAGISPYMELINKGEASFVARDFPGAVVQFQEAVKLDGQKMLGFYRLGEAQLAAGKPEEAEAIWTSGLNKEGTPTVKARLLFCLADLKERQKRFDQAKEAWEKYAQFLKDNAQEAKGYALTPEERVKVIDRRVKDEKDYAAVKECIIKRQAEREKEAEENAKKDKANK